MRAKLMYLFLSTSLFLSGCSTTFVEQITDKDYESFYLRGVFTWWEADESYRIKLVRGKLYSASVSLIADGQPYDFKFADETYAPGYDCGSPNGTRGKVLLLGENSFSSCEEPGGNFQFTPEETGKYDFFIDFTDEDTPSVYIARADEFN